MPRDAEISCPTETHIQTSHQGEGHVHGQQIEDTSNIPSFCLVKFVVLCDGDGVGADRERGDDQYVSEIDP